MHHKHRNFLALLLVMSILFLFSGCSDSSVNAQNKIEQALKMELPNFTICKYTDNHKGYSGELYAVIEMNQNDSILFNSEILMSSEWKTLPITAISYANVIWGGKITPQSKVGRIPSDIENGMWFFCDRSEIYHYYNRRSGKPASESDNTVVSAEICTNFTLAVYDKESRKLYVYIYDELP